jgi:O-antigen ligase
MPPALRYRLAGILCVISAILIFLLPLKFGGIAGIPEIPFFPDSAITWLVFTWPPILFPLFSSLLLALVMAVSGKTVLSFRFILSLIWTALAFVSIIGYLNASTKDFAIQYISHFFGLAAFCISIYYLVEIRPDMRRLLINAVVVAAVISVFMGLQQLLWGFKETVNFVYQQELKSGVQVSSQLQGRILQTRVFSPFTLCNSLAAHLILVIPICLVLIWKNRETLKAVIVIAATIGYFFFFEYCNPIAFIGISVIYSFTVAITLFKFPEKFRNQISLAAVLLYSALMLTILYFSGSRAAVLALGMGIAASMAIFPFPKKVRISSVILVLLLTAAGLYFINAGRHLGSMTVRLDYSSVAARIFSDNILCGTGWGDFFHQYTVLKTFEGTEAPHSAHNFILDFASQTGILGLLVSMLALSFPVYIVLKKLRGTGHCHDQAENFAIILGWLAWGFHSIADINIQIPGTVATALVMITMLKLPEEPSVHTVGKKWDVAWHLLVCFIIVFTFWISYNRMNGEYIFSQEVKLCEPNYSASEKRMPTTRDQVELAVKNTADALPYSPFPWATAGTYFQATQNWAAAEGCFRKASELSPERSSFYHRLFISQMMLGKKQEALESIGKAKALFPNSEEYRNSYEKLKRQMDGSSEVLKF